MTSPLWRRRSRYSSGAMSFHQFGCQSVINQLLNSIAEGEPVAKPASECFVTLASSLSDPPVRWPSPLGRGRLCADSQRKNEEQCGNASPFQYT